MSFFLETFTCDPIDVKKKQSFIGKHTGLPKLAMSKIQLGLEGAKQYIDDGLENNTAQYVLYYDTDEINLKSSKLKSIEAKIITSKNRRYLHIIKSLEQAMPHGIALLLNWSIS